MSIFHLNREWERASQRSNYTQTTVIGIGFASSIGRTSSCIANNYSINLRVTSIGSI